MQAILDLQQQKAEATQVADDWKASSETAWRSFASLEAECSKVRGQLHTKTNEVSDLQQLFMQQSQVCVQIYGLLQVSVVLQLCERLSSLASRHSPVLCVCVCVCVCVCM